MNLRAHLGGDLGLSGRLADDPGLPDAVRERLLAVDVLAEPQRRQRGERVGVFGRAHDDRVEFAGVVVEPSKVAESPCLWDASRRPGRGRLIDVAEGDDVFRGNVARGSIRLGRRRRSRRC